MEALNSEDDEEWLRVTPTDASPETTPTKKRKPRKVITLDDILEADHKASLRKQKPKPTNKWRHQKSKLKSHLYSSSSDDDDDADNEEKDRPAPQQMLDDLEKQIASGAGDEVEPEWGLPVFGSAKFEILSPIRGGAAPVILRALQESSEEEGLETSLEDLARSGFLRSWAVCARRCDESTLQWAYHQMAYSGEESLERATCRFLCDLVSRVSTDAEDSFEMAWLPNLVDLKQTLTVYGYREHEESSEDMETPSMERTPAKNLRSVLDFIATCFMRRTTVQPYYKPPDVAKLLVIMVHLTLERGLLEVLDKVQDCILVLLRYFTPEEWEAYCSHDFNGIAGMISEFTEKPQNAVFVLGAVSGLGKRSVDLQRHVALHALTTLGRRRKLLAGPTEVAALFEHVNLRAKFVDFKRLYYEVVIADTFLWGNEGDDAARLAWLTFLRSCSRQIYIGDERPFATRLRNTASFLVQKYEHEGSTLTAAAVSE